MRTYLEETDAIINSFYNFFILFKRISLYFLDYSLDLSLIFPDSTTVSSEGVC
jgi:hypothetical protein